jgi:hypothetical protein
MVKNVLSIVAHCYSPQDGDAVRKYLSANLRTKDKVILSFEGVTDIPSSFSNVAFAKLLDEFDFDIVKEKLIIIDANKQIADMIRKSIANKLLRPD